MENLKELLQKLTIFFFKGISTVPKLFLRPLVNQIQKLCFKKKEQKNRFLKIQMCTAHLFCFLKKYKYARFDSLFHLIHYLFNCMLLSCHVPVSQ